MKSAKRGFPRAGTTPAAIVLAACFTLSPSQGISGLIDARFRLQRQTRPTTPHASNDLVSLYRGFLARSMSSDCRWLPSDSEFMILKTRNCGAVRGTLLAFSRFMIEHDANQYSTEAVNDHGTIRFVDFGESCDVL